jgi:hypothetical protein
MKNRGLFSEAHSDRAFGSRIRIAHSYVHASRGACFSSRLQSRLRMYRMQQIANASLPT